MAAVIGKSETKKKKKAKKQKGINGWLVAGVLVVVGAIAADKYFKKVANNIYYLLDKATIKPGVLFSTITFYYRVDNRNALTAQVTGFNGKILYKGQELGPLVSSSSTVIPGNGISGQLKFVATINNFTSAGILLDSVVKKNVDTAITISGKLSTSLGDLNINYTKDLLAE